MIQLIPPTQRRTTTGKAAPMRLTNVKICNFRLLRDVDIDLDNCLTLLVGKNNSGKTTLTEAFSRFLQAAEPHFSLTDFSTESYPEFLKAWNAYRNGDHAEAKNLLPTISMTVEISYPKELPEYGPLSAAIVDLDPDCTTALIRFEYALPDGVLHDFFRDVDATPAADKKPDIKQLLQQIKNRVQRLFTRTVTAIDPGDDSNTRAMTIEEAQRILTVHSLKAQRGLDDEKERPKDPIGRLFQNLLDTTFDGAGESNQKGTADSLAEAVERIEKELGNKASMMVGEIIPALRGFGYPSFSDPDVMAETHFDVERLLVNHTRIYHKGLGGISLPESYSGLGSRNLILMLLTLLSFSREFAKRGNQPGVHLVFIEEPEAHLHPQVQEVFIERLLSVVKLFPGPSGEQRDWSPQFVVSTHSSHIVNRADFSTIRYFRFERAGDNAFGHHSTVLNLAEADGLDKEFLHKYLTLTRSDLFFADKAILVEGTSERLIIPAAIRKVAEGLTHQYITIMEVGGAFAHIFFPLLDFLDIPTLIITDIDPVGRSSTKGRAKATTVHRGDSTSNSTIKHWFPKKEEQVPTALLAAAESGENIRGCRYLAFQVPESADKACGRTFEDAFILANPTVISELKLTDCVDTNEVRVRCAADKLKKSDFALQYAITEDRWKVPRYIQRGLHWLASYPPGDDAANQTLAGEGTVRR